MSGRSLHLRLLAAGLGAMALALVLAGLGLALLFERHVERRAVAEAETHLRTLIAGAALDGAGQFTLANQPADPLFSEAYSGLYWQAQSGTAVLARSRSLWDAQLSLPLDDTPDGVVHVHSIDGPRQTRLLAAERGMFLTGPGGSAPYRMIVALDRAEIVRARAAFVSDLVPALALLGLVLAAAFVAQVRIGLRPLSAIRASLHRIRAGIQPRLGPAFPREVTPLAEEIDTLLDERDAAIAEARGRAADLAHGLKTPLTALNADVRRLRAAGQSQIADEIAALGALMQRHVQRELARARVAGRAAAAAETPLRPVVDGIAAAVARTPVADGKTFDFDIAPEMTVRIDRADAEELLGNLIENAARHALALIRIRAFSPAPDAGVVFIVEDDGPGVPDHAIARLMDRGVRLDQNGSGTGLGLAIAQDVMRAYGGALALSRSDLGGLCVTCALPPVRPLSSARPPA